MRDLKIVLTKEQIVSKPHKKVCHYAKNEDKVYLTKIAKDDTLYYKIENNILYIRGTEKEGYSERVLYTDTTLAKNGWYLAPNKGSITKAVIEEPIAPSSCCRFFDGCSGMTEIENFEYIEMAYCESCYTMFQDFASQKINCTNWNVSNVTSMRAMFGYCQSLSTVDGLSNWDVSNVTDMAYMFNQCNNLTSVGDLSNWNVSNVTNMFAIFDYCNNLTSVGDLSNWDVSKVTNMGVMFGDCPSLSSVGDLSNWDVSKVTNMYGMFGCDNNVSAYTKTLTSVGDLSNWDVSKVTDTSAMFQHQDKITTITLPNNIKKVGKDMFYDCSSLASIIYQGTEYTSKSALTTALTNNGCTVDSTAFNGTALVA